MLFLATKFIELSATEKMIIYGYMMTNIAVKSLRDIDVERWRNYLFRHKLDDQTVMLDILVRRNSICNFCFERIVKVKGLQHLTSEVAYITHYFMEAEVFVYRPKSDI